MPTLTKIILLAMLLANPATARSEMVSEAPGWQEMARKLLLINGEPISVGALENIDVRCIKLNNYGCLMQLPGGGTWFGSIGRNKDGYAVFSHPMYSIRAVVKVFCVKHLLRTDEQGLFNADHSPNHDRLAPALVDKLRTELGGAYPTDKMLTLGIRYAGLCR